MLCSVDLKSFSVGGFGGGTLGRLGGNGGGCKDFFLGGFSTESLSLSRRVCELEELFLFEDKIVVAILGGTGGGTFFSEPLELTFDSELLNVSD